MVQGMISTSSSQNSNLFPLPTADASSAPALCEDGRLRKHADYQRVYQATRKQFSPSMTWFAAMRPSPTETVRVPLPVGPRVGLTAGKVLGKAHERNRIKRRMREVVRHHLNELPAGLDLILHPRRSVMNLDFAKLDAEVLRIFRQASAQTGTQRPRQPGAATSSNAPSTAS
jgi:ribonuclease P protein component